ncbi:DUF2231 domain-containing protein [Hydrogenimonas cancrithermarum]|uniref:DUF2231 domain-containing protein n=1 Tax=Hydrogenimonas cancrithermarum TaxID=2993563 RepID=A0ABM8FLV3_9BACT|nr:DUF2231 domain-containing protein [Hydrogenimonas cancrithermarum]BDY12444.1 hypothetical protein HCR_07560 [Hydrogenimonas cancrithermarum]
MSLPAIDIPVQLPFEVPLLVHPIFVHFAIAIPIIVLLIELVNIKAKKPAVSITSLFLLTLLIIVYIGAFFAGKADGSEAFALLTPEAKEELKFHKLLGTYLVYGTLILFLLKALAMLVKKSWARDFFLVFLVVFIGVMFKQGKDGGELVYEYGVNVKAVTEVQNKLDDMQYDLDDLKAELKKVKEECAAKEEGAAAPAESQEAAPAEVENAAPASEESSSEPEHEAAPEQESTHETPAASEHESAPAQTHEESAPAQESHETAPAEHESAPAEEAAPSHESESENTTPVHIPTH